MELRRLKRAVIKEELVALTGGLGPAVVLAQLLYWQARVKDLDLYLQELRRGEDDPARAEAMAQAQSHGWLYKAAEDLGQECMLGVSPSTLRGYLKRLVAAGWVEERHNPQRPWDRTLQYRVRLGRLKADLEALTDAQGRPLGYTLEGWALDHDPSEHAFSVSENACSARKNACSVSWDRATKTEVGSSVSEDRISETDEQYQRLPPETTPQTPLRGSPPSPPLAMEAQPGPSLAPAKRRSNLPCDNPEVAPLARKLARELEQALGTEHLSNAVPEVIGRLNEGHTADDLRRAAQAAARHWKRTGLAPGYRPSARSFFGEGGAFERFLEAASEPEPLSPEEERTRRLQEEARRAIEESKRRERELAGKPRVRLCDLRPELARQREVRQAIREGRPIPPRPTPPPSPPPAEEGWSW